MSEINYIRHLNAVCLQFSKDNRLNPTHISLYIALFQVWNSNRFPEEFYITRNEIMSFSKIGSKSTYHKCIKELSHFKYIVYYPSHNPFRGSRVKMFKFETSSEQAIDYSRTKNEPSAGQAVVPRYKPIETFKTNTKQNYVKNREGLRSSENNKKAALGLNRDNLKTSKNKNYNEPL